jgi:hypothetical protein
VRVDGKPDLISVKVTAGPKVVKGVKVRVTAPGINATGRTNARGTVAIRVNVKRAGVMTIAVASKAPSARGAGCGPKRIGVVGIFLPPVTG